MIDTIDYNYDKLIKPYYQDIQKPLFSQFFEHIRISHDYSIIELANKLRINEKYITDLENGQIWGNVNHINLNQVENIFGLRKNCLKKYLQYTLIEQ